MPFSRLSLLCCAFVVVLFLEAIPAQAGQKRVRLELAAPIVSQPDRTAVRVIVPEGITKAVLEIKRNGVWEPSLVAYPDRKSRQLKFRLSAKVLPANIRVMGEQEPRTEFFSEELDLDLATGAPIVARTATLLGSDLAQSAQGSAGLRLVTESDIWQLRGDTLYFFNQFRGLQIFDVANPDDPALTATVKLQGLGEQMYLTADGSHAVLLTGPDNFWSMTSQNSQAVVISLTGTNPSIVGRLPIRGRTVESRMVGNVLYVASEFAEYTSASYSFGTVVVSFDLSTPAQPRQRSTFTFDNRSCTISATDSYLFVAGPDPLNWKRSLVNILDISDPSGTMIQAGSVRLAGELQDKFKLSFEGTVLRAISQVRTPSGAWNWVLSSKLETFSLADPLNPSKLGELTLGSGETLRATRFAGDRVYVVTFFQIDPLWVVDLSNPAEPAILGHLEIPGYSTHIEPIGNRLVTMGRVDSKAAVSLFDVSNPAAPVTLSQLQIGGSYSSSEAEYDEKAFKVLPEAGLILVPLSSYDQTGYVSGVQLIDLNADNLVARGQIQHTVSPRRATVHRDRVLVVSATDLLSVDITNRDQPTVAADLAISWQVDRVLLAGNYLLEIGNGQHWNSTVASITVAPVGSPEQSLGSVDLEPGEIIGSALNGTRLHIAQRVELENGFGLKHSVFDVGALPAITLLGSTVAETDPGWGSLRPLWPDSEVVVWETAGQGLRFYPWSMLEPIALASSTLSLTDNQHLMNAAKTGPGTLTLTGGTAYTGSTAIAGSTLISPKLGLSTSYLRPFWFGGSKTLLAFDLSDPLAPKFLSKTSLSLSGTNQRSEPRYNFSDGFVLGSKLYLTYQSARFLPIAPPVVFIRENGLPVIRDIEQPQSIRPRWVSCHYLQTIDFSNPAAPVLGEPVNVPGKLVGLNEDGTQLFTAGTNPISSSAGAGKFGIQASSFDGSTAHLISALPLGDVTWDSLLVRNQQIIAGQGSGGIRTWSFSGNQFVQGPSVATTTGISSVEAYGALLVGCNWQNKLSLLDFSNPAEPYLLGEHSIAAPISLRLEEGSGSLETGLWLPLGAYGVESIQLDR